MPMLEKLIALKVITNIYSLDFLQFVARDNFSMEIAVAFRSSGGDFSLKMEYHDNLTRHINSSRVKIE